MSFEGVIAGVISGLLVQWADRTFWGTLLDRATALTVILLHALISSTAILVSCIYRPALVDELWPVPDGSWSLSLLIIVCFFLASVLLPFAMALIVRHDRTRLLRLQATVIACLISWGIFSNRENIHGTIDLFETYSGAALLYLPTFFIAWALIQSLRGLRKFSEALLVLQETVDREADTSVGRPNSRSN